jgi:hypothetical protein
VPLDESLGIHLHEECRRFWLRRERPDLLRFRRVTVPRDTTPCAQCSRPGYLPNEVWGLVDTTDKRDVWPVPLHEDCAAAWFTGNRADARLPRERQPQPTDTPDVPALAARPQEPYPRAPDLQALVERFGGYHLITPEAWAEHDAAMAQWHRARRTHTAGCLYEGRKPETKTKPKPKQNRALRARWRRHCLRKRGIEPPPAPGREQLSPGPSLADELGMRTLEEILEELRAEDAAA